MVTGSQSCVREVVLRWVFWGTEKYSTYSYVNVFHIYNLNVGNIRGYSVECSQSHRMLLWILIMLCKFYKNHILISKTLILTCIYICVQTHSFTFINLMIDCYVLLCYVLYCIYLSILICVFFIIITKVVVINSIVQILYMYSATLYWYIYKY